MFDGLLLASGFFWTVTYLLIIRQGERDQTYGMPIAALCANLSWEFIFAVLHPHGLPQVAVNWIWLGFDLIIAAQVLRFGPREWGLRFPVFLAVLSCTLVTAFGGVLLVTYEFVELDKWSGAYAAFGQNLMMSVLYVELFRQRPQLQGQNFSIAVCKLCGTAFASLGFLLFTELGKSPLMLYLFVSIFFFDILYAALMWQRNRKLQRARQLSEVAEEALSRRRDSAAELSLKSTIATFSS